jgi:hypothetical protein
MTGLHTAVQNRWRWQTRRGFTGRHVECAGRAIAATALSRARDGHELKKASCPGESGVALRLPPQSKIAGALAAHGHLPSVLAGLASKFIKTY